jgi:acetylornithine deacetylase
VAPNVLAPSASAELMFRTVADNQIVHDQLRAVAALVSMETLLDLPPVRLTVVDGFETAVFSFGTDVPVLHRWGRPLLFGPGSIHVAHTAEEFVPISELTAAVDRYADLARRLLAS